MVNFAINVAATIFLAWVAWQIFVFALRVFYGLFVIAVATYYKVPPHMVHEVFQGKRNNDWSLK